MKSRVCKWGESLVLQIPKSMAKEAKLKENAAVDVSLVQGALVVSPTRKQKSALKKLLAEVTSKNLHREIGFGSPQGKEVW
ncbi:MAG TPA: hypothetical protein VGJ15_11390 [Pirellulales bacterium]|jgi:antitoxin MazE